MQTLRPGRCLAYLQRAVKKAIVSSFIWQARNTLVMLKYTLRVTQYVGERGKLRRSFTMFTHVLNKVIKKLLIS